MIIKFEPHGFVIFLTLAMGMAYALSNSRSGWGFWKVALIAIFVLPTLYYGFIIGRVVEVVLGSIIGWVYGRGGILLPHLRLNPFGGVGDWLRNRKFDREQKREGNRNKRKQSKEEKKQSSSYDDKIKRRREQAQRSREGASSQSKKADHSGSDQGHSQNKTGQSESAKRERSKPKVEQSLDSRTLYEILGVSPDSKQAQIKKAYSLLRSRYHPDKYAHMSTAFIMEAEEELKLINKAWEKLKLNERSSCLTKL